MARRRNTTRDAGPVSPFKYGQTVKVKLADGSFRIGEISFVGYLPFPGAWSFEIQTEGVTFKTMGPGENPRIVALTEDMDEEL